MAETMPELDEIVDFSKMTKDEKEKEFTEKILQRQINLVWNEQMRELLVRYDDLAHIQRCLVFDFIRDFNVKKVIQKLDGKKAGKKLLKLFYLNHF